MQCISHYAKEVDRKYRIETGNSSGGDGEQDQEVTYS